MYNTNDHYSLGGSLSLETTLEALGHASKIFQSKLSKLTKLQNITIAEWTLLKQIAAGLITQDQMASALGLDNSTLSRQLKSLTEKALVTKTAVGQDRRQLKYSLDEVGESALTLVNAAYEQTVQAVFKHWPEEEQQQLQIMLNRLTHSISKVVEK